MSDNLMALEEGPSEGELDRKARAGELLARKNGLADGYPLPKLLTRAARQQPSLHPPPSIFASEIRLDCHHERLPASGSGRLPLGGGEGD